MHCLVTGAAGFIGSHLCERLLQEGHQVTGIDAFIPYYPRQVKEQNLAGILGRPRFIFQSLDLRTDELASVLDGVEYVFHLAAMPGLVRSWQDFEGYWTCNVAATLRLLEASRRLGVTLKRWIYASTSSVYGRFASGDESLPTRPASPYGVTKLAAENLCRSYADAFDLPLVTLRYFSVYGPRQRPDMAYHRFVEALLTGEPITVCGDGLQVRGNTYVTDCVAATVAAMQAPVGEVYNVGGGETATIWDIIRKLERLAGRQAKTVKQPPRPGDQRSTFADTTRIRRHLGWEPQVSLDEGLERQWQWHRSRMRSRLATEAA